MRGLLHLWLSQKKLIGFISQAPGEVTTEMRMMAARSRLRAASRGSVGKSPRERDIPEAKKVFEDSGRDALYHTPRGDSVYEAGWLRTRGGDHRQFFGGRVRAWASAERVAVSRRARWCQDVMEFWAEEFAAAGGRPAGRERRVGPAPRAKAALGSSVLSFLPAPGRAEGAAPGRGAGQREASHLLS